MKGFLCGLGLTLILCVVLGLFMEAVIPRDILEPLIDSGVLALIGLFLIGLPMGILTRKKTT